VRCLLKLLGHVSLALAGEPELNICKGQIDLLRRFVPLEKGIGAMMCLATSFACWTQKPSSGCCGIAVDGTSLCGAYERGKSALPVHLVNVFAAKARVALASQKGARQKRVRELWKPCQCCD
jgi:hypothetical protein